MASHVAPLQPKRPRLPQNTVFSRKKLLLVLDAALLPFVRLLPVPLTILILIPFSFSLSYDRVSAAAPALEVNWLVFSLAV